MKPIALLRRPKNALTLATVLSAVLITACSSKPPGCADEQTINLGKSIVLETWDGSMQGMRGWMDISTPDVTRYNHGLKVEIRNITSDGYNSEARKFSCTGAFVVTTLNEKVYTVQREFTSQATVDGNGKFVVQIRDLEALHESLQGDLTRFIGKLNEQHSEAQEKKKEEALQGHSFDCSKADSAVERSICGDPKLSELDVAMVSAYNSLLSKAADKPGVRTAQATWRDMVRNECSAVQCLVEVYERRIEKLNRGDWTWR